MRRKEDMENWRKELKVENEHLKREVEDLKAFLAQQSKIDGLEANLAATMEKWKETEAALVSCRKELAVSASELECEKALRIATEEKLKVALTPPPANQTPPPPPEVPAPSDPQPPADPQPPSVESPAPAPSVDAPAA